jgi:plasmid stabilization system protein ParE
MTYRVVVLPYATQDLEDSHAWAERHAPETADAWLSRISDAIESLAANPTRCPFAKD